MRDVATPINNLVQRWSAFKDLDSLVADSAEYMLCCGSQFCRNHWEQFQRELLCDVYDNLCVLRSLRRSDSFKQADRGDNWPEHRRGRALDSILRLPTPEMRLTGHRLRLDAYRRAWMYYANRPQITPSDARAVAEANATGGSDF